MSISKGKSDFHLHSIGKNIKVEDLQNLLGKLQQSLEKVQGKGQNLDSIIKNDLLPFFIQNLTNSLSTEVFSNTKPSHSEEQPVKNEERTATTSKIYELLRQSSKEINAVLPPLEVFTESLPKVYAAKDYNNIKIVHKDKILLDLDLRNFINKED